jgi:glycosyltransferase involved in cell wall biosynthesis
VKFRRLARGASRAARDLVHLVVDRGANGRRRSPAETARLVRDYFNAGRLALRHDAVGSSAIAERLLASDPRLYWPNRISSASSTRRGELSLALASTRRLRAQADSADLRRRERALVDRLMETDADWLPEIPGPSIVLEPRSPDVVMHLLKASLPDRQSGYTIRSHEILRAQAAVGIDPFVVTPFGYPPLREGKAAPALEIVDGIVHHRLDPGASADGSRQIDLLSRTASLAADVARRERPAIIHAASGHRGYELGLVGARLADHLGLPLVYEVRGFLEASWTGDARVAPTAEAAELTQRRMATEMRIMRSAVRVATLGTAMRDELVERGVPAEKIVIVPNAIDPELFAPAEPDADLRRRYGLEDRFVFGYVSNMDHFREGQATLIEATARLVAEGRRVACLLVGDGTLRPKLEAEAARAGLGRSVVFTGRIPFSEVRTHYALLDAFVVPRVPDRAARFTTPLKPYEAMAMGIPIVVSDLPALTEIAAPGERGVTYAPGDAAALAAVIGQLMDTSELRHRLGAAGRAWVIRERTWAANAARYRVMYRSILESRAIERS